MRPVARATPDPKGYLFTVAPGAWVKRYLYDGHGRLVETQSPYLGPGGKIAREEHFYYDGSRRVQEVVTDPLDIQYVYYKYGYDGLVEFLQNLPDAAAAGLPALPAKVTSFGYVALSRVTSIATSTAVGASPFDTLSFGYNAFDRRCSMLQVTEPPYAPPAGGGGYGGIVFENRIRTFFDNPSRLFGGGRGRDGVTERLEVMDDPQNIERFIRQSLPSSPAAEPDKTLYCACTIPDTSITAKPDIQTPPSWKDAYNGAIYPKNDLVSPGAACGSPDPWPTGSGTSPHDLSPGIPAEHKYGQTSNPNDLCSDAPKFDLVFPSSGLQPQSPPTGPPQAPSNAQPVLASPPANASGVWSGMSNPPAHYNIIQRDASGRIERLYSPDRNLAQGSGTYDINDRNFGYDCDGNLIICSTGAQADLTQELLPPPPKRIEWATKDRRGNLATKADLRSGQPLVSGGPPAAAFPATFDDTYLTQSFTKADQSSLLTQRFPQGSTPQAVSNLPRWDANGNMIDDGERFLYQYDARNRLVAVYHRALQSPQIFARFTYNGIGWRTTAVYDTNGDGSFADETIEYYGYNDAWQLVRIDRQGPVRTQGENAGTRPAIRRYQAIGYLGGQQAARYPTDRPVVRLRDTDGDGVYDEKLSYIQNFRGDVVALVKRVAKLDAVSAHAAATGALNALSELPDNTSVALPVPEGFFEGNENEVNLAVAAAYSTLGYKLEELKSKVDAQGNLPPIPIAGRGMVVERYSYGLYGEPDTLPMADVDRSGTMVSMDAWQAHGDAFENALSYVHPGSAALQGDLRADVDGDGMLSSWDQLRFAQQQTAWMMVTIEAMATGSGEDQNGWSTQNALSRHHPVALQANGEPLSTVLPSAGALSPRDNYKLRGLVQLDNRLGYAGYVWDPFLQMYHVRHRVLNPRLGIWMQPDPIGYSGGWNLHEYAGGDPMRFVDPMGLTPEVAPLPTYRVHGEGRDRSVIVEQTIVSRSWWQAFTFGFFGSPNTTTVTKSYSADDYIPSLGLTAQEFIRSQDTGRLTDGTSSVIIEWQESNTSMRDTALLEGASAAKDVVAGEAWSAGIIAIGSIKSIHGDIASIKPNKRGKVDVKIRNGHTVEVSIKEAEEIQEAIKKAQQTDAACKRPTLTTNPKHHPNATGNATPQPANVQELYNKSVEHPRTGVRWAKDGKGDYHRFAKPQNGETHWNGSTAGLKPIEEHDIPNAIKKLLREQK